MEPAGRLTRPAGSSDTSVEGPCCSGCVAGAYEKLLPCSQHSLTSRAQQGSKYSTLVSLSQNSMRLRNRPAVGGAIASFLSARKQPCADMLPQQVELRMCEKGDSAESHGPFLVQSKCLLAPCRRSACGEARALMASALTRTGALHDAFSCMQIYSSAVIHCKKVLETTLCAWGYILPCNDALRQA